jgi:hypothetical protein
MAPGAFATLAASPRSAGEVYAMVSIDEERKAAKEAQTVISSLVPSTPCTEAQKASLRKAAQVATIAMQPGLSSQTALGATRHDAAMALNVLCGAPLTQSTIEGASSAVEAWIGGVAKA